MDSHSITMICVLVVLVALSAFFSATEMAFSTLSKPRLKSLTQDGNRRAKLALKLADNYDELLSTILIGNNIVNIASSSIATVLFVKYFADKGTTISTIVMTVIILLFGEISPKSIAKEMAEPYAMAVAPVMNLLIKLFKPLNFILIHVTSMLRKMFKFKNTSAITESELLNIVEDAAQDGGIDSGESELLINAIEFNETEAIDIFTPRIDVTAIDITTTNEEIAQVFKESGYSRLPVYEETIDSIVGVINEKDFHNYVFGTDNDIQIILKPAEFIPPSMKIPQLLKLLQKNKLHIAVIVDEFGGTEGIVTIEDILEELVGEIWDEHDEIEDGIKELDNNKYIVPASMELEEFFEKFEIEDNTEVSTINGWVIEKTDKIPDVGDSFDYENLTVKVTKVDGQRADEIHVTVNSPKEKTEDDE